jgi:hypothetical protein
VSICWNSAEILLSFDIPGGRKGNLSEFFSFHRLSVLPDTRLLIDSYTVLFTVSVSGSGSSEGYIESGHLQVDNQRAERAIKPCVIGRKTRCSLTRPMLLGERVLYGLADIA